MSSQLPTEQDLRRALRSLAPEDLDAAPFRQRFDQALARQQELPADSSEATLLFLDWPDGRSRTRRTELAIAIALVACAAAVAAVLLLVVSPGHSERRAPNPALTAPAPSAIRSMLLPGTIVLDSYAGHGSLTFAVPPRAVPAHFDYTVYGTCNGPGTLTIAQQTIIGVCDGSGAFGTSGAVQHDRLVITADPVMSWQITLALAPDPQTNGSVQGPVDHDMTGPNNAVRQSGQGSGTVSFTGETPTPPVGTDYRLRLVCRGSGVTLPDLTSQRASGLQTKTCFAGREYVWDNVRLSTPIRIRVQAAAGTSWTIAIDSM